jgi:acetyl-CoA carboxylase carboxyl transferase subunit beta
MLNSLIGRRKKYTQAKGTSSQAEIPKGMYTKCPHCKNNIYIIDLIANIGVCTFCEGHLNISPNGRIAKLVDPGSFIELDKELHTANPLLFEGYEQKIEQYKKKTDENEAVITGVGKIAENEVVLALMDSRFMMGSMGSVVGEKITRAIEYATKHKLPLIIFTASGGARMQEGIFSLMQMAKTSAALAKHNEEGLLYISILTNPTTGGVTASFAMLGDIILAEPGALIGFAGPRVIEQTINQKLPQGFQKAEFLLDHGMIDAIVSRNELRKTLAKLLSMHKGGGL